MSDTVYENPGLEQSTEKKTYISATRYWGGKEKGDCIQITLAGYEGTMYSCITLEDFRDMVRAVERNVEETKDAFWHTLPKDGV
jgi:hypothetical protein